MFQTLISDLQQNLINIGRTLNKVLFITTSYKNRDKYYYDKWTSGVILRVGLTDVDLPGGNLRYPDSGTSTLPASAHLPELLISPYTCASLYNLDIMDLHSINNCYRCGERFLIGHNWHCKALTQELLQLPQNWTFGKSMSCS